MNLIQSWENTNFYSVWSYISHIWQHVDSDLPIFEFGYTVRSLLPASKRTLRNPQAKEHGVEGFTLALKLSEDVTRSLKMVLTKRFMSSIFVTKMWYPLGLQCTCEVKQICLWMETWTIYWNEWPESNVDLGQPYSQMRECVASVDTVEQLHRLQLKSNVMSTKYVWYQLIVYPRSLQHILLLFHIISKTCLQI